MNTKGLASLAFAVVLGASSIGIADDAKLPDTKTFDKGVIDSLRAVHNKGAELYNTGRDFPAAYRLYQGALEAVKPLLVHRPEAQKLIDTGLAAADKELDAARKAFLLHETIESVRKNLKIANGFQKPNEKKETTPKANGSDSATISGKVTIGGKSLAAGEVTIVSLTLARPRVFTATVQKGDYTFTEAIPPGKYIVIVTGKDVPAKYTLTTTSGLTYEFTAGTNQADIALK